MKTTRIHIAALFALIVATNIFGQEAPQYTRNTADQGLRSNGRVNPSTLGLEIDVPLGGYPSRGINLPLSFSYSSKQWRLQEERCGSAVNGLSQTWARPQFSENAAGGWTSSLSQPYIEYTGEWYRFQDDGEPLSTSDFLCTPEAPRVGDTYIMRIMVYLGGSSHELIAQDAPVAITKGQVPNGACGTRPSTRRTARGSSMCRTALRIRIGCTSLTVPTTTSTRQGSTRACPIPYGRER